MFTNLALALSAILSSVGGEPTSGRTDEDKPSFVRAYEHPSPVIREYRLAGIYGKHEQPFVVSLRFHDGQWDVRMERTGRPPLVLRLDKAYNAVPVNHIMVATDGEDENLIVLIPFGPAHAECFANGSEVYNRVVINSGKEEVSLEDFQDCELKEVSPPVKRVNGVLSVSAPSRGG